jgi:YesN/AraC family two-component response regulator
MLDDIGHTGIAASSAKEALTILREIKTVDMVITDQAMPYMTGTQLAEEIKKEWPNLPVILATGYTDFADGVGSDLPKVSKPFTQQELSQEIMRVSQL